jgi:hypothetical protein
MHRFEPLKRAVGHAARRAVARSHDPRIRGAGASVNHDATLALQTGRNGKLGVGSEADSENNDVRRKGAAVGEAHGADLAGFSDDLADVGVKLERYPACPMKRRISVREDWRPGGGKLSAASPST